VVNIFDDRGELIASLCGNSVFASESTYSASLSSFVPNASGLGGTITIYLNNQPIAVWNGLDTKGQLVPSGFYHFSIIETTPEGNKVVLARDAFIDDETGIGLLLSARPNLAHTGDTVTIFASFSGNPPDSNDKVKIYDLAGELLKTLSLVNGMTNWDLRNKSGNQVGTGLYLVVFDGNNPTTGNTIRKAVKIMFIH
jgi:flagellar hook assembly protein FlgD